MNLVEKNNENKLKLIKLLKKLNMEEETKIEETPEETEEVIEESEEVTPEENSAVTDSPVADNN